MRLRLPYIRTFLVLAGLGLHPAAAVSQQSVARSEDCAEPQQVLDSADAVKFAESLLDRGIPCRDVRVIEHALDLLGPVLLRPDTPAEAWYQAGRGRYALAALGSISKTREQRLIGMSYAERAALALREALKRDPNHTASATLLAGHRLRTLAHITSNNDATAIRRAAPAGSRDVDALLARAQLELSWDQPDSAVAAANRVLELGGDSGLALLSIARAQLMRGQLNSGEATWFQAMHMARTNAALREFRQDIGWVATDAELAAFDSLPPHNRAPWAQRFWARRASADFRSVGERLAEHERRVRFALTEYARPVGDRLFNKAMPYRSDQALVDDRGVVYIRHGPPARIIRGGYDGLQDCPVYSWVYEAGPDRGMVVNFRPFFTLMKSSNSICANTDFKLVPGGTWAGANAATLADYDSLYARWLDERRPLHRARLGRALVAEGMDDLSLAVVTDAFPVHFERSLGAVVRSYGLARPGRLLVAFGVPPDSVQRVSLRGRPALPLQLRLTALPDGGGAPVTFDTTLVYDASRSVRSDQWVAGAVVFPLPPGEYEIRWQLTGAAPEAGSQGLQVGLDVPEPRAGQPTVSALLLGTPSTELRWPTAAGQFPLSASNTYRTGSDVELLVEATDLPNDAVVNIRVRVEPAHGAKGKAVMARFTAPATGSSLAVRQSLNLSELRTGYYRLTVEIEAGGKPVSRSQPLWVVK